MSETQATVWSIYQVFNQPELEPGNDPTAPLLRPVDEAVVNRTEEQQQSQEGYGMAKFILDLSIIMSPLYAMLTSLAVLHNTGVDPLGFALLSYLLVLSLFVFIWVLLIESFISNFELLINRLPRFKFNYESDEG
ncbi:hypothetical protein N431DRAFT_556428 [Stipitochalara longipes BDJ]|nr:hypothetical protein N431DRAFT_556428 [Stipitochalara longipes BDJ]